MRSAAFGLNLIMEFVYIKCHGKQKDFRLNFYLTTHKKMTKTHVSRTQGYQLQGLGHGGIRRQYGRHHGQEHKQAQQNCS